MNPERKMNAHLHPTFQGIVNDLLRPVPKGPRLTFVKTLPRQVIINGVTFRYDNKRFSSRIIDGDIILWFPTEGYNPDLTAEQQRELILGGAFEGLERTSLKEDWEKGREAREAYAREERSRKVRFEGGWDDEGNYHQGTKGT